MGGMTTPIPTAPEPVPQPAAPQPGSRGIAALIVSIVALVLAVIPFASYIAGFVAIVAIVLGVLAARRAVRKGASITAIVLGAVALVLAIVMSIIYTLVLFVIPAAVRQLPTDFPSGFATSLPSDFPTDFPTALPSDFPTALPSGVPTVGDLSSAPETGEGGSVVFRVTGGGGAQTINYTVADSDGAGNATVTASDLPWSKSVGIGGSTSFSAYALIAQSDGGDEISCTITVNGEVVAKNTASGQSAIATCSASQ